VTLSSPGKPWSPSGLRRDNSTHSSDFLINEPNHSHLPKDLQKDLQKQMIIYHRLFSRISPPQMMNRIDKSLFAEIDKIFQEELFAKDIKEKLYQFVENISEPSFALAWTILCETENLYG
jgi:hypothetical protein